MQIRDFCQLNRSSCCCCCTSRAEIPLADIKPLQWRRDGLRPCQLKNYTKLFVCWWLVKLLWWLMFAFYVINQMTNFLSVWCGEVARGRTCVHGNERYQESQGWEINTMSRLWLRAALNYLCVTWVINSTLSFYLLRRLQGHSRRLSLWRKKNTTIKKLAAPLIDTTNEITPIGSKQMRNKQFRHHHRWAALTLNILLIITVAM